MAQNVLPQARQEGLVARELPDEVLVYDLETRDVHCLNQAAAAVWNHCNGETEPSEIALRLTRELSTPVDEDTVWIALDEIGWTTGLSSRTARPEARDLEPQRGEGS